MNTSHNLRDSEHMYISVSVSVIKVIVSDSASVDTSSRK